MVTQQVAMLLIRISGIFVAFECLLIALLLSGIHYSIAFLPDKAVLNYAYVPQLLCIVLILFMALMAFKLSVTPQRVCDNLLPLRMLGGVETRQEKQEITNQNIEKIGFFLLGLYFILSALVSYPSFSGALLDLSRSLTVKNRPSFYLMSFGVHLIGASFKIIIGWFLVFRLKQSVAILRRLRTLTP